MIKKLVPFHLCKTCNRKYFKKIVTSKKEWEANKYCSRKCIHIGKAPFNKGKKMVEIVSDYKHWNQGKNTNISTKNKISQTLKGHNNNTAQIEALNLGRINLHKKHEAQRIFKNCFICNKHLILSPSLNRNDHQCCSMKCYGEYQARYHTGKNAHAYINGASFDPYPPEFSPNLRRAIRRRDKFTCQICFNAKRNKRLDVHHIDFDKQNNSKINLVTLCISCHSKITYKNRFNYSFPSVNSLL